MDEVGLLVFLSTLSVVQSSLLHLSVPGSLGSSSALTISLDHDTIVVSNRVFERVEVIDSAAALDRRVS